MRDYDVVIVGSGSTGAVLAARLSENPARSVLLLEAGSVYDRLDQFPQTVLDPSDESASMPGNPLNWGMLGTLVPGVQVPIPRGKGMGGSSSINGAYFQRGTRANFDDWVKLGNDEWAYEKVLPHYKRSETDHDFQNDVHGVNGPVHVRREPADRAPEFTDAFTAACMDLGFGDEPDKNSGGTGGIGPVPMNIWNRQRQSTALVYLLPAMGRENLTVIGGAHARRVVLEGTRAVGVAAEVNGQRERFRGNEIVLSAGALRSPQLLMLSGIGPAAHLGEHGIDVVMDLPGVGSNLMDHPELSVQWEFSGKCKPHPGRGVLTSALNWTAQGSLQSDDLELLPFVATAGDMMRVTSMAKNPKQALSALIKSSPKFVIEQAKALGRPFIAIGLQQEDSRGTVRLASQNPADQPVIDWNLMAEENDRRRFREGIQVIFDIFASDAMRAIRGRLVNMTKDDLASAKSMDDWAMSHIFAVGHPSCTCRMGPHPEDGDVVDQYGRVHGIEGLRIADTSIFPKLISRGPNATAIMLGERIASFMADRDL